MHTGSARDHHDDIEYIALSVMADIVVLSESESVWLAALFTDALKLVSDATNDSRQFRMLDNVVTLTAAKLKTRINEVIEQRLKSSACATTVPIMLSREENAFRAATCDGSLGVPAATVPVSLHSAPLFDVTRPRNTAKPAGVTESSVSASVMIVAVICVTIVVGVICWQWSAARGPKRKYTF